MMLFVNLLFIIGVALFLAWVLGLIGGLLAYFLGSKHKRKRKVFLAAVTPAVAIGVWTVGSLVTVLLTSIILDIDLGIGDSSVAHLPNGYKLVSIDDTEHGNICDDGQTGISTSVTHIQVIGDTIIGCYHDTGTCFFINTRTGLKLPLDNDKQLASRVENEEITLLKVQDFYWESRKVPYVIGTVITLMIMALTIFLLWKIGLYSRKTA